MCVTCVCTNIYTMQEFAVEHDDYQATHDDDEQEDYSPVNMAASSSSNPTIGVQDAYWKKQEDDVDEEDAQEQRHAKEEWSDDAWGGGKAWNAKEEWSSDAWGGGKEWNAKEALSDDAWGGGKAWNAKEAWSDDAWGGGGGERAWNVKTEKPDWAYGKKISKDELANHTRNQCQSGRGTYVAGGFIANDSSGGGAYEQLI